MKTQRTTPANSNYPQTTVTTIVEAPIGQAFNYIAPIYLPHIFPGAGLIPGIVNTSINEGWNQAGLTRTVYFADGSTSQETMLTHNGPTSFSYKNDKFTSPVLGALIARLEGEWLFTDLGNGKTNIEWTYRTIPTNSFARLFIRIVLIPFLKKMLQQALDISRNDLETGNLIGAHFPVNKL
ncbi:Polyketide cyclase / dehydrase and lipid transport [Pedobacter terrae]|uniref:Polyketide cyclase / dehydrase and lipid transport n=1 Tax=Pedobacter terrae TaxID=405671 RepID=A0A1G7QKL5_9SPHI|nr:SRPBCC family protein [Pedobacter terrae]SDF99044.1 Polyketide cyclase / dehydrase and lipid transport [Pedobacter terrae]